MRLKLLKQILCIGFELFLGLEILLRSLGIAQPILYIENDFFEYCLAPNQNLAILGNHIVTNKYGMRNYSNSKSKIKILGLGDSILNGGQLTDHDELATSILSVRLSDSLNEKIEILNISAGSWGPDNNVAFLNQYGSFDSKVAIWVVSSHDYTDNMTFLPTVGRLRSHPKDNPPLALFELFEKLIIGIDYNVYSSEELKSFLKAKSNQENPGIRALINYCKENDIQLIPFIHPTLKEFLENQFDENGMKIIEILESDSVKYYSGLDVYTKDVYSDGIHLNEKGQVKIANVLFPHIVESLRKVY